MMNFTGERFVPELAGQIAIEHLHRYAIATALCKDKDVLDIASGEGYGSNMLSKFAKTVSGVDVDKAAVLHSQKKYVADNLKFKEGSVTAIPFEENSFDLVVSFETLEHISEHETMLQEIKRVLRPNGTIIISTPNKKDYSDEPNYNNKFHLKELYLDEFDLLLEKYFKTRKIFFQNYFCGSYILSKENSSVPVIFQGDHLQMESTENLPIMYFIAICSDKTIPDLHNSLFNGQNIMNNYYENVIANIYGSRSYRFLKFFYKPLKPILSLLKK
jgi:2-polyprenyl-3-methyl-5-hydroxy-6-metoxy-1,4-benzoquinol methylase